MISKIEAKQLINDLFEEEALVIGGLVAVHRVDDEIIWRLVKNLDAIRSKTLRRIEDRSATDAGPAGCCDLRPHPAVEDFLIKLRRACG